jgi:hypothetical protein
MPNFAQILCFFIFFPTACQWGWSGIQIPKYLWPHYFIYMAETTSRSNETELLDESRGNWVSSSFRNSTSISPYLRVLPKVANLIASETLFSENHPGAVSTSSSLPQSSLPWRLEVCSILMIVMMVTVSMIFFIWKNLNRKFSTKFLPFRSNSTNPQLKYETGEKRR